MTVYVERKGGDWWSRNCYDAARGFADRGFEVKGFHYEELQDLPLTKETVVYGTIRTAQAALLQVGVTPPPSIDIPEVIQPYAKRKIWNTNIHEVKSLDFEKNPIFIKPKRVQKAFTGFVLNNYRELAKLNGRPDDFELIASEVVRFRSEWRYYVLSADLVGVGHYKGDLGSYPNITVAYDIIREWKDQPIAYSIDLGALGEDRYSLSTALVEVNDAYALGNYGIPSLTYAKMIEARWFEMVGLKEQWLVF